MKRLILFVLVAMSVTGLSSIANAQSTRSVFTPGGHGTNNVLEAATLNGAALNSPVMTTPSLGVATATSLTMGATNVTGELAGKVPLTRSISTTGPMTGGGDLSANRTLLTSNFVASGALHASGLVPDPGASAGTTKFLREDASWQVPAGGGGGGTSVLVNGSSVTNPNFTNNYDKQFRVDGTGTNVTVIPSSYVILTYIGTNVTVDATAGNKFKLTLNQNTGVLMSGGTEGDEVQLRFKQDGTGNRLLSMALTNFIYGTDITGVTLSTNSNYSDLVKLECLGSSAWLVKAVVRGYNTP